MAKRFDPDELLALALAYTRERSVALVRTGEEILASARAARARAIETRKELPASRQRSRAAFTEAMKARERMRNSARAKERERQLRLIRRVVAAMEAADLSLWLFGGWGLDARLGRITREHGDIEFWVERQQAERSRMVLVDAGAVVVPTQPVEESREYMWDEVPFSTAYFDRQPDGTIKVDGRWSDWNLPADSFGDDPGSLVGHPVPTMSATGILAMKEQYPTLRNGRPWRDKDRKDIAALSALVRGSS